MVRINVTITSEGSCGTPKLNKTTQTSPTVVENADDTVCDVTIMTLNRPQGHKATTKTVENVPWFCYLMKQMGGHCKNEANVKVSDEPFKDVCGHNRGDVNDKATKPARGLWQVELICGPFYDEEDVLSFREELVATSRGLNSRRTRCIDMVEKRREKGQADLYCFDKRLVPHPLNRFLQSIGLDYLQVDEDAYKALVTSLDVECPLEQPV